MSFLTRRPLARSVAALRPALVTAPRAQLQIRFATQDYGSGKGNPAGESPQQQGKNPSENLEHPGPPPPKVAQGKSSSSPNEDSGNSSQSAQSSSSSSGDASKSSGGGEGTQEVKGAKPKILNANPPGKNEESEDVKRHNEDMKNRTDRAHEQVANEDAGKDKVPKGFWSGQGGRDKEP